MYRIYFAAPLFNYEERSYNEQCCDKLEKAGFEVFLPQRDSGEFSHDVSTENGRRIFNADIAGIDSCNCVVAIVNGRALDEGTIFECGYGFAKKMPVFYICDDTRKTTNLMLTKSGLFFRNMKELIMHLHHTRAPIAPPTEGDE